VIGAKHTFHLSISSVSQGFSVLCVEGMSAVVWWINGVRKGKDDPRIFCRRKFQKPLPSRSALARENAGKSLSPPKHQKPSPHSSHVMSTLEQKCSFQNHL
jgi:hypothetical protein